MLQNRKINAVIIGSSGAVGSEFVNILLKDYNINKIYAFSRQKHKFNSDKIIEAAIDLENEDSIKNAAQIIGEKIDLIIIATGILHNEDIMPEKSLREIDNIKFLKILQINTIGPALIAKYFIPKLNKDEESIFAAISARVGSISDNRLGGWYSYRASKSALNMILKNLAIELKRTNKLAKIIGLHPGTVDSNLSKPFQASVAKEKLFLPSYSAQKLLDVINQSKDEDSGKIFDFNNIEINP
ncbi:SDR family NAD(P)-dependent oxidoreductase [Rickettsiales bacterium]|nr:SDR family NAD(P)-dependent oxidoreductase [Rickettsiales bacterium]